MKFKVEKPLLVSISLGRNIFLYLTYVVVFIFFLFYLLTYICFYSNFSFFYLQMLIFYRKIFK